MIMSSSFFLFPTFEIVGKKSSVWASLTTKQWYSNGHVCYKERIRKRGIYPRLNRSLKRNNYLCDLGRTNVTAFTLLNFDRNDKSALAISRKLTNCWVPIETRRTSRSIITVWIELWLWNGSRGNCGDVFAEDDDVAAGADGVEAELLEDAGDTQLLVIFRLRIHVRLEAPKCRGRCPPARARVLIVLLCKEGGGKGSRERGEGRREGERRGERGEGRVDKGKERKERAKKRQ